MNLLLGLLELVQSGSHGRLEGVVVSQERGGQLNLLISKRFRKNRRDDLLIGLQKIKNKQSNGR